VDDNRAGRADGEFHALAPVRLEGEVAYCCSEAKYEEAIRHPEACIEVGFPLADVKMKRPPTEAAFSFIRGQALK
jgi:hypothetical protein